MTPTATQTPGTPLRFLIVDDDPDHINLMTLVLREEFPGVQVTAVGGCEEAQRCDPRAFDLALIDVNLPDGSGIDVLKALHTRHPVPTILVTGERFGEPAVQGIRAGAADYIVKHGDYLQVLPVLVHKTLAAEQTKAENRRLDVELRERNAELERLNAELQRMAAHDPLTGLYNRRHFSEMFHHLFAESDRYGSDLTCMMIDVDAFKEVNDRLGHLVGDRILVLAADAMRTALRASDVAGRYGGDEFVAILPRTTPDEGRQSAKRLRLAFADLVLKHLPSAAGTTLSMGLASREQHQPATPDALLRLADGALYQAKAAGKNRIMVVRPFVVET